MSGLGNLGLIPEFYVWSYSAFGARLSLPGIVDLVLLVAESASKLNFHPSCGIEC